MRIRKIGYIVLGGVGVGLGAVGVVLPLLPAFPFCWRRSALPAARKNWTDGSRERSSIRITWRASYRARA